MNLVERSLLSFVGTSTGSSVVEAQKRNNSDLAAAKGSVML